MRKLQMKNNKKIISIIVVLILFGTSSSLYIINIGDDSKDQKIVGSISGFLLDIDTDFPIIDEISISLLTYNTSKTPEFIYTTETNFFIFKNLDEGNYLLSFHKSWDKQFLNGDPFLYGGYILPSPIEISINRGENFFKNYYFDFYANLSWESSLQRLNVRNNHENVVSYSDTSIWPHENSINNKSIDISVIWENTMFSRADFTINVLDYYVSTEDNIDDGSHIESLEIIINDEFIEQEREIGHFFFTISVDYIPTFENRGLDFTVIWLIE
jgi:hypothetical protein